MPDLAYLHQQRDLAQIAATHVLTTARDEGRTTLTQAEDANYRAHMRRMRDLGAQIVIAESRPEEVTPAMRRALARIVEVGLADEAPTASHRRRP